MLRTSQSSVPSSQADRPIPNGGRYRVMCLRADGSVGIVRLFQNRNDARASVRNPRCGSIFNDARPTPCRC
jgi:hypothetical protein